MITVRVAGETVVIPGRMVGCEPSGSTTGCPSGSVFPVYVGPSVITTPGTCIENRVIDMLLSVQAADVTVRRCLVRGAAASKVTGLIDCRFPATKRFLLEDCTVDARVPSAWLNGAVMGHDFTARRCDVAGVVDGFGVYNTTGPDANVVIEGCWIHDLTYFAPDYATGGRAETHNDGVQVQSGRAVVIRGNRIDCFMSTTKGQQTYASRARGNGVLIQTNVAASPATDYSVEENWFHGGGDAAQLCLRSGPGVVWGNVFDRSGFDFGNGSRYQIRLDAALQSGVVGLLENRWSDGSFLAVGRDAGIRLD